MSFYNITNWEQYMNENQPTKEQVFAYMQNYLQSMKLEGAELDQFKKWAPFALQFILDTQDSYVITKFLAYLQDNVAKAVEETKEVE